MNNDEQERLKGIRAEEARLKKLLDDYLRLCHTEGLKPEHLGCTLDYDYTKYSIIGLMADEDFERIVVRERLTGQECRMDAFIVRQLVYPCTPEKQPKEKTQCN